MTNHTLTGLPSLINATDVTVAGSSADINGIASLNHYGTMTSEPYVNKLEAEIIRKLGTSDSNLKYSVSKIKSNEAQVDAEPSIEIEIICKMKHSVIAVINDVSNGSLLNLMVSLIFVNNIENSTKEELIADIKLELTLLKMDVLL